MIIYRVRDWGSILEINEHDDIFDMLFRIFEIKGGSFQCWDELSRTPTILHTTHGGMSCRSIGEQLGISVARVGQIEAKALRKLRWGKGCRAILREFYD